MHYVQLGRKVRTILLCEHPDAFATLLQKEWSKLPDGAAVRLNVFSDIRWNLVWPELVESRPDLFVYGYSKWPMDKWGNMPDNYYLTFSASERNSVEEIAEVVATGVNVAVPFKMRRKADMPDMWNDLAVIDGDLDDARYKDPRGVVVGLRAKGKAFMSDNKFIRSL